MHLTYQKLGTDHPMYGKVDYLVMDELTPVCYKTQDGYLPLAAPQSATQVAATVQVETQPLFVLSFKINGEAEEMTFTSKKKADKTQAELSAKSFVTDLSLQTYQIVA